MRQKQFVVIEKLIFILKKAHNNIDRVINLSENINEAHITELFTVCQNTAIKIGEIIEEAEGENCVTVTYLEDYCELVYSLNEEICNSDDSINPDKINKKLNKMLLKIENSIKHDIPRKREAVFLPYKASMWDSLESVWEAAEADPDCDAYVIPIPYFDKNPDGSVREEHYEADLFPENVPITHYSEYDFGKHHPDMIFIHNPYDYGNLVTTIHPFFYAENMKKVTDCLVYIPYFATSGAMSESREWCPVYDYVDYIVIQHESFRKYYSVDIPEEKFLPLGSPKFDKVIKKCQNPPKLKEEWQKRIDGRKVFFYNTSLNGMLQDTPQFLRKMQYVFETFKNHPECCLLWRPHPLFESTLHAMRPECIEVFNALKQHFLKQENWIYDDTPSVEDTIAICDGYIGDSASSIVALFGVAGKRIFIIDNSIVNGKLVVSVSRLLLEHKNAPMINDVGNEFTITEENVLYRSKGNNYKYERYIDFCDSIVGSAYGGIYKYKMNLILAPCTCQNVVIIDDKKKLDYIKLNEEQDVGWVFEESYIYDNKLVLVPHDYSKLVILNLDTREVQYIDGIQEFLKQKDVDGYHYGCSWLVDNNLFITDPFCMKYLRVSLDDLRYDVIEMNLNIESKRIVSLEDKEECWILHINGPLVTRFNLKTKEKKEIDLGVFGLEANSVLGKDKYYFNNVVQIDERLLFSPLFSNKVVEYNLKTEEIKAIRSRLPELNHEMRQYGYFTNENGVFYDYSAGKCIDLKTNSHEEIDVIFDKEEVLEDLRKFKRLGNSCRYCNVEKGLNLLEDYLTNISQYDYNREKQIKAYGEVNASINGDAGEKIYFKVIENIEK